MHVDENDAIAGGEAPKADAAKDAVANDAVANDAVAKDAAARGPVEGEERDGEERDGERRGRRKPEGFGETVQCRPLEVIVKDDRVEQAIRQLKNRLAREGVLRELKNRRHYFKPSELKRIKSREAARRRRKQARQRPRSK